MAPHPFPDVCSPGPRYYRDMSEKRRSRIGSWLGRWDPEGGSILGDTSDGQRLTRRSFQEALISLAIMLLLVGFLLQFLIYAQMGVWLDENPRLGQLLGVSLAVAVALSVLLLSRWRTMRRDMVRRSRVHEQLQLLKEAVETMEIGITISDTTQTIKYVNQAEASMHGYEADELLGRKARVLAPRDLWRGISVEEMKEMRRSRRESVNVRKDGLEFPVQLISNVVFGPDGEPIGVVTSCEDISDRKRAEDELRDSRQRLRALAQHLEVVREKERARIAHEIHNDVGAALTVLKINLAVIEEHLARESSDQIERVHRMLESIDGMIDLIRSISRRLRPFLLDDVGVNAAIEWHVQDVEKRTGLLFHLSLPAEELALSEEVRETLFRVFQEATTNSLRHARSQQLWVELLHDDDHVQLTIRDDGVGITDGEMSNPSGFGLLGLRERVELVRGEMDISGTPGEGTMVRVRVPFRPVEDGDDQSPDRG